MKIKEVNLFSLWIGVFLFVLWRFDPIPGHALPLRGFPNTLTGNTNLGTILLDE
jgi:hypothetical protein